MAIFVAVEPKKDLEFEFRHLHPFYECLSKNKNNKKISDNDKIQNAFSKSESFFTQYPDIKSNVSNLRNQSIFKVLDDCKEFFRKISNPDKSEIQDIIKKDDAARWLVCYGERLGGYCAVTAVSNSQIRSVFGQIKSLEMVLSRSKPDTPVDAMSLRKLQLLIPRLAYAAKREGGGLIQLSDILSQAIRFIETTGDFMRFSQFFEAILAYHKAYGGK